MYASFLKGLDLAIISFVAQIDKQHGYNLDVQDAVSQLNSAFPGGPTDVTTVVVGMGVVGEGGEGASGAVSGASIGTGDATTGLPPGVVWNPGQTTQGPAPNPYGLPPSGSI
jgi:hypothetical protein